MSLALYFLLQIKTGFYKGIAYPFLLISGLLLVICTGVVLRTSQDIERVTHFVQHQPERISTHEIPRMKKVMQLFKIIKIIEICLSVVGLCFLLFSTGSPLLKGIGLGLFLQATMLYFFDHVAENRGKLYWDFLQHL